VRGRIHTQRGTRQYRWALWKHWAEYQARSRIEATGVMPKGIRSVHCTNEPLLGPLRGRDPSRELKSLEKGEAASQVSVQQQRPLNANHRRGAEALSQCLR
jgi:hypothetical protein